jgi:hypothetical protein
MKISAAVHASPLVIWCLTLKLTTDCAPLWLA